jgi:hypothetical protein
MLPFIPQVNLLRYLIVWRVNGSFVQLPRCLSVELSRILGTLIAERLPTQQSRPWRKALEGWGGIQTEGEEASGRASAFAEAREMAPPTASWPAWPIGSILWSYPGKRAYGQGEPLLWELKLLGDHADHGLFLEVILPAMEAAASTSDERWHRQRTLWGRFDIDAVYVSHGLRWEPLVHAGRLDLGYRATPSQWSEGLTFEIPTKRRHRVTWLTPFGIESPALGPSRPADADTPALPAADPHLKAPALRGLLDALMTRLASCALGKRATAAQAWALLSPDEQTTIWQDCDGERLQSEDLERAPKGSPGRWIGVQHFTKIPPRLLPYLDLAATLHLGNDTHFGCGTFALE